jgi:hypothetical protein
VALELRAQSPEERARSGRFPGETSTLCLIWAVLERSSRGWRDVVMTPRAVSETLPSPTEEAATLITA